MSSDFSNLKNEFLQYVEIEKGRALKTVANYDHYLSRFIDYTKIKNIENITESKVRDFRLWLNRQIARERKDGSKDTLKRRTQNYYLIALRAFLKFLAKRGYKTISPESIELAKVPERSIDLINREELDELMSSPDVNTLGGLRDKAMLELLFSTGLRVSELCALSRDINLNQDDLSLRGKGEKVRVVFLSEEAKKSIKDYLAKRTDIDDSLFIRITDEKMGKEGKELR